MQTYEIISNLAELLRFIEYEASLLFIIIIFDFGKVHSILAEEN